jgi:filamentous hemagglutinin family protein
MKIQRNQVLQSTSSPFDSDQSVQSSALLSKQSSIQSLRPSKLALALASALYTATAVGLPTGQSVSQGSASFDLQGSQLNITNSNGTVINWQDFSIGSNEAVRFIQDSSNSAVLNRVTGPIPSAINGALNSNGRVFVINPNGVVIGQSAQIDVAGFLASTLNITDEDFAAGRYNFSGQGGKVENRGYIAAAKGGEVVLIAPTVENSGVIQADDGQIVLAAGTEVSLQSIDSPDISFKVSAPGDAVLNLGQLLAKNGSVKVFADSITQSGSISATRAVKGADGSIHLEADSDISVSGNIDASGQGQDGGSINILGDEVAVSGANINADGGNVLIGGDYQGVGSVKNAKNTTIDSSTNITADAGSVGDGGRVIVWSDGTTKTYATITAKGGSTSGDGGFVETSGKGVLEFGDPADVSATNGAAGTWLLDPEDIVIGSSEAESISTALNGGSNVEVKTSDDGDGEGNISVNADITKTEGDEGVTLTLDAHNRVDVNASISSTAGPLNVNIKTGRSVESDSSSGSSTSSSSASSSSLSSVTPVVEEPVEEPVIPEASEIPEVTAESVVDVVPTELGNGDTEVLAFVDHDVNQIVISEDISTAGGNVSIQAGESGDAIISSSITTTANENSASQQAGDITIEANRIALTDDAELNASGEQAGTILVGGDKKGQNPDVQNAEFTYTSEETKIKADGGVNGDGGKVIVFASDTATVDGVITARGGSESGDGGFIETSGLKGLTVKNAPDASATNGENGEWLIDPYNITVGATASVNINTATSPFVPYDTGAYLDQDVLRIALLSGDVTIDTNGAYGGTETGNVYFEANIDFDDPDSDGSGSLTINAANDIYFRGNLIDSDSAYGGDNNDILDLTLNADSDNSGYGGVIFDGENLISSAAGAMNVEVNGSINVSGQYVTVIGASDSSYGGGAASINLIADNDQNGAGDINFGTSADKLTDIVLNALDSSITVTGEKINFYASNDIDIDAGTNRYRSVLIEHDGDLNFYANNIDVQGGSGSDTYVDILNSEDESGDTQNIQATNDINLTGGGGDSSGVSFASNNQDIDANNITLQGGTGESASAEFRTGYGGTQNIDTTGKLTVKSGSGNGADARIKDESAIGTSQYINAQGGIEITGAADSLAQIYSDLNQVITVGTAANNANLTITGPNTGDNNAWIKSDGDQTITVHGDLILDGGGISANPLSRDAVITVDNLKVQGGNSTITRGGEFGGQSFAIFGRGGEDGYLYKLITNGSDSSIDFDDSGDLSFSGLNWVNNGTTTWSSGDVYLSDDFNYNSANIYNNGIFKINAEGEHSFMSDMYSATSFVNNTGGTVVKDDGTGISAFEVYFYNEGGLLESQSGVIDFGSNGFFNQYSGETRLKGGDIASANGFYFYGGELNGGINKTITTGGTLFGDVHLENTTVNPGHSPGSLTIEGNLNSGGYNVFNMEAQGPNSGEFDTLTVSGNATFHEDDDVKVIYSNGFTGPAPLVFDLGSGTYPTIREIFPGDEDLSFEELIDLLFSDDEIDPFIDILLEDDTDDLILVFLITSEEDSDLLGEDEDEDEDRVLAYIDDDEDKDSKGKSGSMCVAET